MDKPENKEQQKEEGKPGQQSGQPEEPVQEKTEQPETESEADKLKEPETGPLDKQPEQPSQEEQKREGQEKETEQETEKKEPEKSESKTGKKATIYTLRTTANREDQVMDFVVSNAAKKGLEVYSVIRPHGMRGYIFLEAGSKTDAEQAAFNVPYARGVLSKPVNYHEIEHMLEQVKKEVDIRKNDIAEIISGPFKREKCKITRIDKQKEEVVVELLEAAVPIPITVKMDAVRVIRREGEEGEEK